MCSSEASIVSPVSQDWTSRSISTPCTTQSTLRKVTVTTSVSILDGSVKASSLRPSHETFLV